MRIYTELDYTERPSTVLQELQCCMGFVVGQWADGSFYKQNGPRGFLQEATDCMERAATATVWRCEKEWQKEQGEGS